MKVKSDLLFLTFATTYNLLYNQFFKQIIYI